MKNGSINTPCKRSVFLLWPDYYCHCLNKPFPVDFFSQDDADVATAKSEFDQLYKDALGGNLHSTTKYSLQFNASALNLSDTSFTKMLWEVISIQ